MKVNIISAASVIFCLFSLALSNNAQTDTKTKEAPKTNSSVKNAEESTPAMSIKVICILVNDYDEAIAFYTGKLGWVVKTDAKYGNNQRWVSLKPPGDPSVEISLGLATTPEDKAVVGKQSGRYPFFVLVADDLDRTYSKLKSNGVDFQGEPKKGPGGRGVTFKDLYGNIIYLMAK